MAVSRHDMYVNSCYQNKNIHRISLSKLKKVSGMESKQQYLISYYSNKCICVILLKLLISDAEIQKHYTSNSP